MPWCSPVIRQVTSVPLPVGASVKVTSLVAFHGLRNESLIPICSGVEETISIEPWPALRLPCQA